MLVEFEFMVFGDVFVCLLVCFVEEMGIRMILYVDDELFVLGIDVEIVLLWIV